MQEQKNPLSWLSEIKPIGQEVQEEEEKKKKEGPLSWLSDITPIGQEKIAPEKEPFLPKVFDTIKKILPMIPGVDKQMNLMLARQKEKARPKGPAVPTMRAATPEEVKFGDKYGRLYEMATQPEPPRYPESTRFEKVIDPIAQFMTYFADMWEYGAPGLINEIFFQGEMPPPKSELSEFMAAIGNLAGMARGGTGKLATMGVGKAAEAGLSDIVSPAVKAGVGAKAVEEAMKKATQIQGRSLFGVGAKLANKIWAAPAKTLPGKIAQNVLKNANTLGFALGAGTWEGQDPMEILKNKGMAFIEGEILGTFFGGMQFMHFKNANPILSYAFRMGIGSAILDLGESAVKGEMQHPFDERSIFQKAFDYGLNAYFLRHGVSASNYHKVTESVLKEVRRFNSEAKKDGFNVDLPESVAGIEQIVGKPEAWERPGEIYPPTAKEPRIERFATGPTRYATEKTILPPEMPEAERIVAGYKEARGEEIGQTINLKQKGDGSWDITLPQAGPTTKAAEPVESKKQIGLDSLWGAYQLHPRVLYKDIVRSPHVQSGSVTPEEAINFFESKGKEVLGKPVPKIVRERAPRKFKDPLLAAIYEQGRVKPNADYSREELKKVLPPDLIAGKDDPSAKAMDVMAQALQGDFPKMEGDVELWKMLAERKAPEPKIVEEEPVPREIEEFFEKGKEELPAKEKAAEPLYRISPELRAIEKQLSHG